MSLSEQRQELADTITAAGIPATAYVPAMLQPPQAIVAPGAPYLAAGQTFGTRTIRFLVRLVAESAHEHAQTAKNLDDMIDKLATTLDADGWSIEEVAEPGTIRNADQGGPWLYTDVGIADAGYTL